MPISAEEIERIRYYDNIKIPAYPKWYGMKKILFQSLNIPSFLPCNVHLQHGAMIYGDEKPDSLTLNNSYPFLFYCNQKQIKLVERFTSKPTFPIGSIFPRYRKEKNIRQNINAKGTLVFPSHSTHHVKAIVDWSQYVEKLKILPDHFHPITVCIYWKDVLHGVHKYFEEGGFDVVTCGHMFDFDFPIKFYEFLQNVKYTCSNMFGSYVYYSVDMDIPFFMYGNSGIEYENNGDFENYPEKEKFKVEEMLAYKQIAIVEDLFSPPQLSELKVSSAQKKFVNEVIGESQQIHDRKIVIIIYLAVFYTPIIFCKLIIRKLKSYL